MNMLTFTKTYGSDAVRRLAERCRVSSKYLSHVAYGHAQPSTRLARDLTREAPAVLAELNKLNVGVLTCPELRPDVWSSTDSVAIAA